jgi:hypothetical protein
MDANDSKLCFVCKLREKEIEIGTKQPTDKGGMKKLAGIMIDTCFVAPLDFMERYHWKEEKLKDLLVCIGCFRWFFSASEVNYEFSSNDILLILLA